MPRNLGNPGPLGLCAFALTTFVVSCYNAGIFGVSSKAPVNVVTGLAVFYGGLGQFVAGMWEFAMGNTFGATAFTSYAAFWLSYSALLIPWFGIGSAYAADPVHGDEISKAIGIFLLSWTIFTVILLVASLHTNIGIVALLVCLSLTFLLLTIDAFGNYPKVHRAGGFLGIITAVIAWYNGLALLLVKEGPYLTLPIGKIGAHEQ